jgi:hypothetical protein
MIIHMQNWMMSSLAHLHITPCQHSDAMRVVLIVISCPSQTSACSCTAGPASAFDVYRQTTGVVCSLAATVSSGPSMNRFLPTTTRAMKSEVHLSKKSVPTSQETFRLYSIKNPHMALHFT